MQSYSLQGRGQVTPTDVSLTHLHKLIYSLEQRTKALTTVVERNQESIKQQQGVIQEIVQALVVLASKPDGSASPPPPPLHPPFGFSPPVNLRSIGPPATMRLHSTSIPICNNTNQWKQMGDHVRGAGRPAWNDSTVVNNNNATRNSNRQQQLWASSKSTSINRLLQVQQHVYQ